MILDRRIFYVKFILFWCLIFFIENKTDFEKNKQTKKKAEEKMFRKGVAERLVPCSQAKFFYSLDRSSK